MSCDCNRLIPGPNGSELKEDPKEYTLKDFAPITTHECDCKNWAFDGIVPMLSHHRRCTSYSPVSELTEMLKELVKGIESWGGEEDGIYEGVYEAYKKAKIALGQFDFLTGSE